MRIVFELSHKELKAEDKLIQNSYFEKWKYKILWNLKVLEPELTKDEGFIVIPALDSNEKIVILGFPRPLAEKIYKILRPVCYPT